MNTTTGIELLSDDANRERELTFADALEIIADRSEYGNVDKENAVIVTRQSLLDRELFTTICAVVLTENPDIDIEWDVPDHTKFDVRIWNRSL